MDGGLALAWAPAVIAVMSLVYAASAYPAGQLQDKVGARPLLLVGLLVLIAADLVLASGSSLLVIFLGIGLWGLHMGLTQGVLAALIAATAPERLRGTAFGLFGLVTGLAALIASVLAGVLWDQIGAGATFLAGAAFAAIALIAFLLVKQDPGGAGKRGPLTLYSGTGKAPMQAQAISFRKMNGLGNDFVVLDARARALGLEPDAVRAIADRKEGIGCDQIIVLEPSKQADVFMRIWNADGGEVGAAATRPAAWRRWSPPSAAGIGQHRDRERGARLDRQRRRQRHHRYGRAALRLERDPAGRAVPRHAGHRTADRADRRSGAAHALGGQCRQSALPVLRR